MVALDAGAALTVNLVLVDVDGTLLHGPSSEQALIRFLWREGRLGPRQLAAALAFTARYLPRYGRHVFKKNKAYLSGARWDELEALCRDWVGSELLPRICPELRRALETHRAQGDHTVLLTGTLEPIAAELARALSIPQWVGTLCDCEAGHCTARPPLRHPFHAEKLALARDLERSTGLSLTEATAYGDSRYDLPLLEAVGCAVAVHPDPVLRARAAAAGWRLIEHAAA